MPTRRQFLTAAAAAAAATPVATVLYTFFLEPHWLQVTKRTLTFRKLPPHLHGRTLAHLTDLHVGPQVSDKYLINSFRRVAELQPDFVVCTGDWISYRGYQQFDQLSRVLEHFPRGRLGTIGILGNHDYGYFWRELDVADSVAAVVQKAGVTMLRNEAISIEGLRFIGLDDLWTPRFAPRDIIAEHAGTSPGIVLCHNPDAADLPVWGSFGGWILAGHTHGGQCKPPFLPPPLLPVRNPRYTRGVFDVGGGRELFISAGVGHLLQVRFNVRPEIPFFTLRSATTGAAESSA